MTVLIALAGGTLFGIGVSAFCANLAVRAIPRRQS